MGLSMRYFFQFYSCLIVLLLLSSGAQGARVPRALILGIDGLRGDALQKLLEQARVPQIKLLTRRGQYAKCPSVGAVTCAKAHSGPAYNSDFVWNTGPGWGSVISGLNANHHNIKDNGHRYLRTFTETTKTYPTIFKFLKQHGYRTAAAGVGSFLTAKNGRALYPGIVDYECGALRNGPSVKPNDKSSCNLDFRFTVNNQDSHRDDKITDAAISWINKADIKFIMLVLDQVDSRGHSAGFDLAPGYLNEIQSADTRVGKLLKTIEKRVAHNGEDWLVILTSDHGGHNQSKWLTWLPFVKNGTHGTLLGKDEIVPFIVAAYTKKPTVQFDDLSNKTDVRHFDTFKTIAKWFGLDKLPTAAMRDGHSRIK